MNWVTLAWQLTVVSIWLVWKAIWGLARVAAMATSAVLPDVSSPNGAIGIAALAGGAWALLIGVAAALSGDASITLAVDSA